MLLKKVMQDSIILREKILADEGFSKTMEQLAEISIKCLQNGGKILFCGNGGSAADAQHLAAELSGRFAFDRPPLAAEALHVNTSFLTAVANDYSFNEVYARMVKAVGKKGDILLALSTSGNSPNILNALKAAQENELITVGFTGETGGTMKDKCDYLIQVPSNNTARIQEVHITLGHILCEKIESGIFGNK